MSRIRRGVSLYSLQDAYGAGGLGLEGCVAAVEAMGAEGIELLSDQMITGAHSASDETIEAFRAIMERHPLELVSNDIFINSKLYDNRILTLDEQADLLRRELLLAHRLGFRLVRLTSDVDARLVPLVLDEAERLEVGMTAEIHGGMSFRNPATAAWTEQMRALNHPLVGIHVDLGIFVRRLPRVLMRQFVHDGMSPDVAAWMEDVFASGSDPATVFAGEGGGDVFAHPDFPDELTRLFQGPQDAFFCQLLVAYENSSLDVLDEYLPWIRAVHGKVYEMVEDPSAPGGVIEPAIDTAGVVRRLDALGWEGFISSEYEGQRSLLPDEEIHEIDQVAAHQRMLDALIQGE